MENIIPEPIELSSSSFVSWLVGKESPKDITASTIGDCAIVFGRLLGSSIGRKDSFLHLVRRRKKAFIYPNPPKTKDDITPPIYRLMRRIGFQYPGLPQMDIMSSKAWELTDHEDPSIFGKFILNTMSKNIPEILFSAIERGMTSHGAKIADALNSISENMTLEPAWHAWKSRTGKEENDPEILFNKYLQIFIDQKSIENKIELVKSFDPDNEWFDLFQAAIILRYEQVLRHRAAEWALRKSEALPHIPPKRKERILCALS